jgi:hypothetical protein
MKVDFSAEFCKRASIVFIIVAALLCAKPVAAASDSGDVVGKVIAGYQGWFNAAGDGSPVGNWQKWVSGGAAPGPNNMIVSIYPDTREYPVLFQTNLTNLGNGQPAKLFSSFTAQTIDLHFKWMQTYGIDGAALQRFPSSGSMKTNNDSISKRMMRAAETYGRKFYIMYDISQMGTNFDQIVEQDWTNTIVNALHLTSSPAYAKQNGKTVVCLWGIGFNDGVHPGDATQSTNFITWFKNQGLYVIGGVPTYWRTCTNDSKAGFQNVYKTFHMVEPWLVGRFNSIALCDNFKQNVIGPDWTYCQANGMQYAPVMFPGFAWGDITAKRNEIPRLHGDFMWRQAYNVRSLGIPSAYVAMFDECNEGTAILKAAEDASMLPGNRYFLPLNADGVSCSSDFYLRLVGDETKMIKGITPAVAAHPTPHRVTANVVAGTGVRSFSPAGQKFTIRIVDLRGRTVRNVQSNRASSGASMLPRVHGVYFAQVYGGARLIKTNIVYK